MSALCFVLALAMCVPSACVGQNSGITVAAAADLTDPLKEIATAFERKTGNRVRVVFGSSGNLAVQIRNGAPFDVFLSADMDYPRALAEEGLADADTLESYAVGSLAVLVPANLNIALEKRGLDALLEPVVKRIAIANPAHAPYGRAAEQLLRNVHLYDRIAPKMAVGENVAQAAQFVISGNSQVGIVSRSQALAAARGGKFRVWEPPVLYSSITQGAVVLSRSPNRDVARSFVAYLKSADSLRSLAQYGFAAGKGKEQPSSTHR